jgi:hypothetical protein
MIVLETNTIGNIENPTDEDIRRAFRDGFDDVGGNIYCLKLDDGTRLVSVSGDHLRDFSIVSRTASNVISHCTRSFSRDEAESVFLAYLNGENETISKLQWITM